METLPTWRNIVETALLAIAERPSVVKLVEWKSDEPLDRR